MITTLIGVLLAVAGVTLIILDWVSRGGWLRLRLWWVLRVVHGLPSLTRLDEVEREEGWDDRPVRPDRA